MAREVIEEGLQQRRFVRAEEFPHGGGPDLHRLALASKLGAEISAPPLFDGASPDQALHGGEDYELLFTLSPRTAPPTSFEGLPLTRIGTMRKGRPGAVLLDGIPLAPLGYDHFRAS